jgi:hypothetical protein
MIGAGPGGLEPQGIASGEFGPGNTGATGFVGADDAAMDGEAGPGGGGSPMAGGLGRDRAERERRRQAWMAEDADIWQREEAGLAPPLIST